MPKHVKGVSGSTPSDPEGGVKFIQVVIKMNALEAIAATQLAQERGISRSELIRQLLAREVNSIAKTKAKRTRA